MEQILELITKTDWQDIESVSLNTKIILKKIKANKLLLRNLMGSVQKDEELFGLCEHYDFFDKIMLLNSEKERVRIRLHIFLPKKIKRPHYHRWMYSSMILHGGYRHLIYGTEELLDGDVNIKNLKPRLISEKHKGSFYTLDHDIVHSIEATPFTVSLFVTGPPVKDHFVVCDKMIDQKWREYGSEVETFEEKNKKKMTRERLSFIIDKLKIIKVL